MPFGRWLRKTAASTSQRIHTPVNRAVADLVFTDFEATVREMVDNHGKCSDMNIDKHCSWCDYEPLCRAKLQGLDVDYIKEREYTDGTKPETDSDEKSPSMSQRLRSPASSTQKTEPLPIRKASEVNKPRSWVIYGRARVRQDNARRLISRANPVARLQGRGH
jgi:hypothetical protein